MQVAYQTYLKRVMPQVYNPTLFSSQGPRRACTQVLDFSASGLLFQRTAACAQCHSAQGHIAPDICYFSFAYSALACCRMGMSGSASFQRARKSWYAVRVLAVSPCKA